MNLIQSTFLSNPDFDRVWKEFKAMRKKLKKPLTENAESRQLVKVEKLYEALDNDISKLVAHMEVVTDSCWQNVYANDEHFNNIINQSNGKQPTSTTGASTGSKRAGFKQATNYYTFNKNEKYYEAAEGLRVATEGFDFVGGVAE